MKNKTFSFSDFLSRSTTFIETGSHVGEGIYAAIKAGFQIIKSVEADKELFEKCEQRFGNYLDVELYFGLSTDQLPEMLADIDYPCVFWLDAHAAGEGTFAHEDVMKKRNASEFAQDRVLTRELEIILAHSQNHTILIDDQYGENPENIKYRQMILAANADYQFEFLDKKEGSTLYKNKVLACTIDCGS